MTREIDSFDAASARAALDGVAQAQAGVAAAIQCPPWRHAAFGAIFAALIGSVAVSQTVQMMTAPAVLICIAVIVRSDRRRMGAWVNGYRRGRTLPVTLGFLAMMMVLVVVAMKLRLGGAEWSAKAGLAALAGALGICFSVVWQRVYRAELRA
jgi:hypothetical protein